MLLRKKGNLGWLNVPSRLRGLKEDVPEKVVGSASVILIEVRFQNQR